MALKYMACPSTSSTFLHQRYVCWPLPTHKHLRGSKTDDIIQMLKDEVDEPMAEKLPEGMKRTKRAKPSLL